MANAVSYEFLKSLMGAPNGLPVLDGDGQIPISQLPDSMSIFKGQYEDETELTTEVPSASIACFAYVNETGSFWYWNAGRSTAAWVNQEIEEDDYLDLTDAAKSMVPYLVIPNIV